MFCPHIKGQCKPDCVYNDGLIDEPEDQDCILYANETKKNSILESIEELITAVGPIARRVDMESLSGALSTFTQMQKFSETEF